MAKKKKKKRKMSSAEPLRPVLVDKEKSRSAVWKYFAFEANEQGKVKNTNANAHMQTMLETSTNERC